MQQMIKQKWRCFCIAVHFRGKWLSLLSGGGFTIAEIFVIFPDWHILGWRPVSHHLPSWVIGFVLLGIAYCFVRDRGKSFHWADKKSQQDALLKRLRDELGNELEASLTAQLRELASMLCFGLQERVSIYILSQDRSHFRCAARHSKHDIYGGHSPRREKYPSDTGIIGHVYQQGRHEGFLRDNSIPCARSDPANHAKYLNDQYEIDDETSRSLRMKSCDIVGIHLNDKEDNFVGIVIVESEQRDFLSEENLRSFHTEDDQYGKKRDEIIRVLERLKSKTSPSDATPIAEEELFDD